MAVAGTESGGLRAQLAVLRRRRRLALLLGGSIALLFVLLALFLPSMYRSTATILIEEPEIPANLVRSTITSFGDKRIETIYQRVMTGENLLAIVREYDLYPRDQTTRPREVLIGRMRDDLGMEIVSADVIDSTRGASVKATIAFKVWYEHKDPNKAYKVANTLTSLFLNENLRSRAELASATTKFLSSEAEQLSGRVQELERALATFKQGNVQALPELKQVNLQLADRVERDVEENRRLQRTLSDRRALLRQQLSALAPAAALYDERGERQPSTIDRLQIVRTKLVEARSRYSANHPDVRRLEEEISALARQTPGGGQGDLERELAAQKSALATLRKRYSDSHPEVQVLRAVIDGLEQATRVEVPDGAPTNPIYVQTKGELDSVELDLAAASSRDSELRSRMADYESRLSSSPEVEREYASLAREYDSVRLKYAEVREKQFEAEMSEAMEVDRKGERFELIEPPLPPEEPVSPNRTLLLWVGVLLAVLLGGGSAFIAEALDPRVEGTDVLTQLTGVAPIAVIPYLGTSAEISHSRRLRWLAVAAALVLGLTMLLLVHFFVLPLQTLFWGLAARFGWLS